MTTDVSYTAMLILAVLLLFPRFAVLTEVLLQYQVTVKPYSTRFEFSNSLCSHKYDSRGLESRLYGVFCDVPNTSTKIRINKREIHTSIINFEMEKIT
jgi:hypothetical protein